MTFPAHFSRSEIGRVNQILKRGRGMSMVGSLQLRREISESRWLAGVWYTRLAMPDMTLTYSTHGATCLHDLSSLRRVGEVLHVIEDALLEETPAAEAHRRVLYAELHAELKAIGRIDTSSWSDTLDHFYNRHEVHRYKNSPWSWSVFWHIVDLAMVDYRMKNRMSRATRRWGIDDRYVVCSYCGTRLYQRTLDDDGINEKDYTRRTNDHTLTCALWFMMNDERVIVEPGGCQRIERVGPNINTTYGHRVGAS